MSKLNIQEGNIVLCTVTKIIGTSVFVHIEDYNLEGSINFPEIAPGRIRNIRDYAFPGKRIICRVLKIHPQSIELSLRRVKTNERNDFNDKYKKEKSYIALIKTIIKDADKVIENIRDKEGSLFDLIEKAKETPSLLDKYISKEDSSKIIKILKEKESKSKETILSRKITLSNKGPGGIIIVKSIIKEACSSIPVEISYLAAGRYLLRIKSKNPKQSDNQLNTIIENIEKLSKKNSCFFNLDKE